MIEMKNGNLYIDGQYIPPVHMNCRCTPSYIPEHTLWDTVRELGEKDRLKAEEDKNKLLSEADSVIKKAQFDSINPDKFGDMVEDWLKLNFKPNLQN